MKEQIMGTLVAVKKGGEVCLAADSQNLREPRLSSELSKIPQCILRIGESFVGLHCSVAFLQAFEQAVQLIGQSPSNSNALSLSTRHEISQFFTLAHQILREHSFLNVTFDQGQEFEWMPMLALVINRHGIFKVDHSRAVYPLEKFWALGSGEDFAFGAIAALFDSSMSAEEIARSSLNAVKTLDSHSGSDLFVYTIRTPLLTMASGEGKSERPRKKSSRTNTITLTKRPRK